MASELSTPGLPPTIPTGATPGEWLDWCLAHACSVLLPLDAHTPLTPAQLRCACWPQTWPNTTCGFGGIGGQAMTTRMTCVVIGPLLDAAVYHGQYAYRVALPSEQFWTLVHEQRLPGASHPRTHLDDAVPTSRT